MQMVKNLFQWCARTWNSEPGVNDRKHTEHYISLEKLIEILERTDEAPRLLAELRRERFRAQERGAKKVEEEFEARIW